MTTINRRQFLAGAAGQLGLAAGVGGLVVRQASRGASQSQQSRDGRLSARVAHPTMVVEPGLRTLGLSTTNRNGLLYVPPSYRVDHPLPFILALHGATGAGAGPMRLWREVAEQKGYVVLSPDSRAYTWDGILGGFGPDVEFIDQALRWTFDRVAVDASRMAISGFSDGASYALSLGLANGDLFQKVAAFSPGFIVPAEWRGQPRFFLSHGLSDPILPIEVTSRRIVVQLQRGGYSVRLREFDGGHEVPPVILAEAVDWLAR